ncbi:AAEL009463-PA, partial [Aedes aegypti]
SFSINCCNQLSEPYIELFSRVWPVHNRHVFISKMGRDRLHSMIMRREFAASVESLAPQHEYGTLLNQRQIIQDLGQFTEIFRWIRDLQQNVLDIEKELFGGGSIKASQKLGANARLCDKIHSAVRRLQEDLQKLNQQKAEGNAESSENNDMVSKVRHIQFESVKAAYYETYWKFRKLVMHYELVVKKCDQIDEQIHPPRCTTIIIEDNAAEILQAVEERHQELRALEKTLFDMRDVWVLFSTLVMQHGSMLNVNQTESKVQHASNRVATAAAATKEAHYYYRNTGGTTCCCINVFHCLLVLLAIMVTMAVYLALKKFVK